MVLPCFAKQLLVDTVICPIWLDDPPVYCILKLGRSPDCQAVVEPDTKGIVKLILGNCPRAPFLYKGKNGDDVPLAGYWVSNNAAA